MKKLAFLTLAALLVMGGNGLFAQVKATKDVTLTVNLLDWYYLSVTPNTLTFEDPTPTAVPPPATKINANEYPVAVTAFALLLPSKKLELTLKANGTALQGTGTNTIAFDAIKWTASGGDGMVEGTLSISSVTIGSWTGWYHNHTGNLFFTFDRDYTTQAPDTYTATATYILSVV